MECLSVDVIGRTVNEFLGVLPPAPPNDALVTFLFAQSKEQLWRVGFDRLARCSRSVAATCRDLLTNTTSDGETPYACWVVRRDSLDHLLSILLDQNSNSRQLANRALVWAQAQQPYLQWLEQAFGTHIVLAIANPTVENEVIELRWQGEGGALQGEKQQGAIALAAQVPAGNTLHYELERPPMLDLSMFGPEPTFQLQQLHVSIGDKEFSFPIVPSSAIASPPNVQLATLYPLWNLHSIQRSTPDPIHSSLATSVQVRKLLGAWEIFVDCNGLAQGEFFPSELTDLSQLRGVEALTILHPSTDAMLCVSPEGDTIQRNIPSDAQVHSSSNTNSWSVRVVLPSNWVRNEELSFSIVRSHGDSMQIETGPLPCVPWHIQPTPIVIDISKWDEVEHFPTRLPIH